MPITLATACRQGFFAIAFKNDENLIRCFYLTDDPKGFGQDEAYQLFLQMNPDFKGNLDIGDLSREDNALILAQTFGLSDSKMVNDPKFGTTTPEDLRPACDTDPDYDPKKHPFFIAWNGRMDSVLLAYFLEQFYIRHKLVSAKAMHTMAQKAAAKKNPEDAIRNTRAWQIRKNLLLTGRFVSLNRLNETQPDTRLNKIASMLGLQVHTEPNSIPQECANLLSDTIRIDRIFSTPFYQAQFQLRQTLLKQFPEIVYEQKGKTGRADIRPSSVREHRILPDDTSARYTAAILSPYGCLDDQPAVSFLYPGAQTARKLGIRQVNVLDESKEFFYSLYEQESLRLQFDAVYSFFKRMEGKNYNNSERQYRLYGKKNDQIPDEFPASLNLPLFDRNGKQGGSYVTFSLGGIHGGIYNRHAYEKDLEANPGASLFIKDKKRWKLNPAYGAVIASPAVHEDFVSYYPSLLMNLDAYFDPLNNTDKYRKLYDLKESLSEQIEAAADPAQKEYLVSMKDGIKRILNSASGASASGYDTSIRMNNRIISMRIIGQFFLWRLAQAQSHAGGGVLSVNTDGLYSIIDFAKNRELLAMESEKIRVRIEPEAVMLVSKDANNRLEVDPYSGKILSSSGGTLASRISPNVTKSPLRPTVIDWALAEYLVVCAYKYKKNVSLNDPFDMETGKRILSSVFQKFEPWRVLIMFSWNIHQTEGSILYGETKSMSFRLPELSRLFLTKQTDPAGFRLKKAEIVKVDEKEKERRKRNDLRLLQDDPKARSILEKAGFTLKEEEEAHAGSLSGFPANWSFRIDNRNFYDLKPGEISSIVHNLNIDAYAQLLKEVFEKNWRNKSR